MSALLKQVVTEDKASARSGGDFATLTLGPLAYTIKSLQDLLKAELEFASEFSQFTRDQIANSSLLAQKQGDAILKSGQEDAAVTRMQAGSSFAEAAGQGLGLVGGWVATRGINDQVKGVQDEINNLNDFETAFTNKLKGAAPDELSGAPLPRTLEETKAYTALKNAPLSKTKQEDTLRIAGQDMKASEAANAAHNTDAQDLLKETRSQLKTKNEEMIALQNQINTKKQTWTSLGQLAGNFASGGCQIGASFAKLEKAQQDKDSALYQMSVSQAQSGTDATRGQFSTSIQQAVSLFDMEKQILANNNYRG